ERRVDAMLGVSGTEEKVEVRANATQVETTNNTLGGTISEQDVADLPVNGRDFTKFLVLVPGATADPSGATDSPGSFGLFSSNGNRGRANNYLLDGTDMNDGYRNLPAINEAGVFGTPATILPIEAISEAAILSNFEAEYGRNSGAIVNIVTKSGTNDFHGSLFEFFRNDKLDARNPWPAPNRPLPLFDNTGRPNLFVTTPASNDVDSLIAKIDHSFNKDNQLTGRYFYGTSDQSFPLAILAGNVLPGYNTTTPTKVHLVSISYLKILSPTKVNELRFGFNRFKEGFFSEDSEFDQRSIGLNTGITSDQDFGLPQIRIHDDLGI